MAIIPWLPGTTAARVELVGTGNAAKADTLNRALRSVLTGSGLDPDADFPGFLDLVTAAATYLRIADAFTEGDADGRYLSLADAATTYLEIANSFTQLDADALYAGIGDSYTKVQADAAFLTETLGDAAYLKLTDAAGTYLAIADAFTQTDADALYLAISDAFTESDADTRYLAIADAFTEAAADAKYLAATDGTVSDPVTFEGLITASGGVAGQVAIKLVSDDYTLTADDQLVLANVSAGDVTITAPAASGGKYGWEVWPIGGSTNKATIAKTGTDTIEGSTSVPSGGRASVATDGTSKVHVRSGGASVASVRNVSAATTLLATDYIVLVDTTDADVAVSFPPATTVVAPLVLNVGANDVTFAADGTDTLDGPATLGGGSFVGVLTDGVDTAYVLAGDADAQVAWDTGISGKPTNFQTTESKVTDEAFFAVGDLGATPTLTWTAARKKQSGTLDQAATAITLAGIPDGGYLEMLFTTGVADCAITWDAGAGNTVVEMSADISPPAGIGDVVSYLVLRNGTDYLLHKTGENAA